MANRSNKYEDNAVGPFFVDSECIDCMVCQDIAPDNFIRNDKRGYSYVFNQPASPEQEALCREALEACPVNAIGSDVDP